MTRAQTKPAVPGIDKQLPRAQRLIARARRAHERHQFSRAYHLFGEAIQLLELLWSADGRREVGEQLAAAYIDGSFCAARKCCHNRTPKRSRGRWQERFIERYRKGITLQLQLADARGRLRLRSLIELQCSLNNLASALAEAGHHQEALDFIAEAHRIQQQYRPDNQSMHPSIAASLNLIKADCLAAEGLFEEAVGAADEAISLQQSYMELRRKQKRRTPPTSLLESARSRRQQLTAAAGAAAGK